MNPSYKNQLKFLPELLRMSVAMIMGIGKFLIFFNMTGKKYFIMLFIYYLHILFMW